MTATPDNTPEPDFDRVMASLERERLRYKERGPGQSRALWMRLLLLIFLVVATAVLWGLSVWLEGEAKTYREEAGEGHARVFYKKSLCATEGHFLDSSPLPRRVA